MIRRKLKDMRQLLSVKEQSVADYILNNTLLIKTMSIHTLSQATNVSTSTVLRFCNKLGYDGFSEFKIDLISSFDDTQDTYLQEDISLNDDMIEVNKKIYQMEKSALNDTYDMLDLTILNEAISLIEKSNKIVIYGAGSSALIGKELEYQLIKINKNILCHFDYNIQYNITSTLDENDLLIIISSSGKTVECVQLLELSKQVNVPSIAITRKGRSKVATLATIVLFTSSYEEYTRLIPIKSKISQLSIINILVTNLFIKNYPANKKRLSSLVLNQKYLKK